MKKYADTILWPFILLLTGTMSPLHAQTYLGIGAGFSTTPKSLFITKDEGGDETSGPAVQVRLQFPLKNKWGLSLDGNYYLDKVGYAHYWAVDLNATYKLFDIQKVTLRALLGANAYWVTVPAVVNTPLFGGNIGAVAVYDLSSVSLWAEFRYTPGKAKHRMLALGAALRFGEAEDDDWD